MAASAAMSGLPHGGEAVRQGRRLSDRMLEVQ
jgi:hypothetical protein